MTARRTRSTLSLATLFLIGAGIGGHAGAQVVNVDAVVNDAGNPVLVPVPAGTYQAKLVPAPTHPLALFAAWSSDTGEAGTWGTHYRIRLASGRDYFGGRATAADSDAEALARTPNRAVIIEVPVAQNLRFFVHERSRGDNVGGVSVLLEPAPTQPGRIGADAAGQLRVSKVPMSADLGLQWGASCSPAAADYAVYEGALGSWSSHVPSMLAAGGTCTTSRMTSATIKPVPGNRYLLVVPQAGSMANEEGSYGAGSDGIPRARSSLACRPVTILAECDVATETIFVATGDVDARAPFHGLLRITQTPPADSGNCDGTLRPVYTPDATLAMTVNGDLTDGASTAAYSIFPHGIFYSEKTDELLVAGTFTSDAPGSLPPDPCGPGDSPPGCTATGPLGSIGVIADARSLAYVSNPPGAAPPQVFDRHVYFHPGSGGTDATTLDQPHSVWYDHARREVYVANSSTEDVAVFTRGADGNVAPLRSFDYYAGATPGLPFSVFYDATTDTLFVGAHSVGGGQPEVAIFKDASTRTTGDPPDLIVYDDTPTNGWGTVMVHNVLYDPVADALWIANHSPTVFRHFLDGLLGANETADYPATCSLAGSVPRCFLGGVSRELRLEVSPSWIAPPRTIVTGGIWLDDVWGRLYAAVGENNGLPVAWNPATMPSVNHAVMVYDDVRSLVGNLVGPMRPPPDRTVCWNNADVYYGPQPLSVLVEY